jgi:hypothetical protein
MSPDPDRCRCSLCTSGTGTGTGGVWSTLFTRLNTLGDVDAEAWLPSDMEGVVNGD